MTGLVIVVTVCASLAGETTCRVAEVPTDLHDRAACAIVAEVEANAALNAAVVLALAHGVHVESVSARCAGVSM